jgi:hypothetical protein
MASGEVVPRRTRTQENSYDFSWRSRTQVRLLREKSYSTILGYEFSWRICTQQMLGTTSRKKKLSFSFIKSWVRLLLRKTLPFLVTKSWVRALLWKNFVIFSQAQNLGYEFSDHKLDGCQNKDMSFID